MTIENKFTSETNVQHKDHPTLRGVVVGNVSEEDQVAVEWSDGTLAKVYVRDLQECLSAEAEAEEAFKKLQKEVNAKLEQAASLILKASELAEKGGSDLHEQGDDYDHLFNIDCIKGAMSNAGWNTSSWYC